MEFFRQEYWNGLPFPSPGHPTNPGIELGSPALQADSLPLAPPGKLLPILLKAKSLLSFSLLICEMGINILREELWELSKRTYRKWLEHTSSSENPYQQHRHHPCHQRCDHYRKTRVSVAEAGNRWSKQTLGSSPLKIISGSQSGTRIWVGFNLLYEKYCRSLGKKQSSLISCFHSYQTRVFHVIVLWVLLPAPLGRARLAYVPWGYPRHALNLSLPLPSLYRALPLTIAQAQHHWHGWVFMLHELLWYPGFPLWLSW